MGENERNYETIDQYDKETERLKKEKDKYHHLCAGLCEDLKKGIIDKEEFEHLYKSFCRKEEEQTAGYCFPQSPTVHFLLYYVCCIRPHGSL